MPKNTAGGKAYKKRKNKGPVQPGPINYADDEQEYGIVTSRLGNGLIELMIAKGSKTIPRRALGKIRGVLRKRRVPFHPGSIVLVSGRDSCLSSTMVGKGDNRREKVDVLECYYEDQAKILYRQGEIPSKFRDFVEVETAAKSSFEEDDDDKGGFEFTDEADEAEGADADDVDIDDL